MDTLAERVAYARTRLKWSQSELARQLTSRRARTNRLGVSQQSINQLEQGGVSTPRYVVDLAQVLSVGLEWLLGDSDIEYVDEEVFKTPLISWVEAGELADVDDPYDPGDAEEWLNLSYKHGNMIALRVRGSSMNKVAVDNSIIVVDLDDRMPIDGKHYVFRHEGRATFKTYRQGPPQRMEPQSDDPEYQALYPKDGIEVVGRVIRKSEEL